MLALFPFVKPAITLHANVHGHAVEGVDPPSTMYSLGAGAH